MNNKDIVISDHPQYAHTPFFVTKGAFFNPMGNYSAKNKFISHLNIANWQSL